MMDTILNLGLNDETVQGVIASDRQPALRLRLLPPLRQHVRRRRARLQRGRRHRGRRLRGPSRGDEGGEGRRARHGSHRRRPQAARRRVQGGGQGDHRRRLPRRPARAAVGRDQRRVRQLEQRPRRRLPPHVRHPRRLGHGGQRADDGLRQHRRRERHRRRLHAQPRQRRERLLRRVPRQRAGRRRGRRGAHAAPGGRARRKSWPDVYAQLMEIRQTLESELRDMQDFEFTIEKGRLFMLQTRNGKRTGLAAIRIAVDLCDQGLISPDEALMRIEPEQLNQLLRPIFGPEDKARAVAEGRVKAKGLPAGPGAASGRVVFSAARRRGLGRPRRAGPARPRLHQPQGHPRHGRRPGHPHGAGRHDQSRGARRAPDGQGLHRRLRCARHRHEDAPLQGRRRDASRKATGSASTASPARSSSASSRRVRPRCCRCCSRRP